MSDKPVFGQDPDDIFHQDTPISHPTPAISIEEEEAGEPTFNLDKDTVVKEESVKENIPEISKEELDQHRQELTKHILGTNQPKEEESEDKKSYAKLVIKYPPFKEMEKEAWEKYIEKHPTEDLFLPSMSVSEFVELVKGIPGIDLTKDVDFARSMTMVQNGFRTMPRDNVYQKTTEDESRLFLQELESEGQPLKPATPTFKTGAKAQQHSGEAAVIRMMSLMGKGSLLRVPLWHSGFWVTIKTPTDAKLLDMDYDIMKSRINLGRNLLGAIFSNDQVYLSEQLISLFMGCLYSSTLHPDIQNDILDYIKLPDLQTIAWAMASVVYPNGFPYTRPVFKDNNALNGDTIHGIVDISKLFFVDDNAISDKQKRHMVKKVKASMSKESLEAYQDNFVTPNRKVVKINDNLSIVVRNPSIREYLESGQSWMQQSIDQVNQVLSEEDEDNKRNDLLTNYFKASILSQYKHYIQEIHFLPDDADEPEIYSDQLTIDALLERISSDDIIKDAILIAIRDFMDESVVSLVGTPTISGEKELHPRFPNIVPMDALYTFFTLTIRKTRRIKNQELLM